MSKGSRCHWSGVSIPIARFPFIPEGLEEKTYPGKRIVRRVDVCPAKCEGRAARLRDGVVGAVLVAVAVGRQGAALVDQVPAAARRGEVGGGGRGDLGRVRLDAVRVVDSEARVRRRVGCEVGEAADDAHGVDRNLEAPSGLLARLGPRVEEVRDGGCVVSTATDDC